MRSTTVKIGKVEVDIDYYSQHEECEISKIEYKRQDVTDLVLELVDYIELIEKIEDSLNIN